MKIFPSFFLLFLCQSIYAQQLSQVTFTGGTKLSSIAFLGEDGVLIRISEEGKILEWGFEIQSERVANYYAPKLQPYMGRVDYYGLDADSAFRGKVKSIGTCFFTYYNQYETEAKIGKLKSVGNMTLDYYANYDDVTYKGRLKYIGSSILEYYSSYENEGFRGKLKTLGNSAITYFSTFDDKYIRGKVKSIGGVQFPWYTSLDRYGYGGGLKSGIYRQNISGITYILQ